MPFELEEVVSDADFDEIVNVLWLSYENPFLPYLRVVYPIHGAGPDARAESMREAKERTLKSHMADSASHWIKVVDTDTGKIIAAAKWLVYETNPYSQSPAHPIQAYWWPEGDGRNFASRAMQQQRDIRTQRAARPHLLLNICFTHPKHRRLGAGNLLMEWGTARADAMGVEAFVESTELAKPLYEKHGFVVIDAWTLKPTDPNPSEEWRRLEREILPINGHFMWRPIGGKYEKGKTVIPWKTKSEA